MGPKAKKRQQTTLNFFAKPESELPGKTTSDEGLQKATEIIEQYQQKEVASRKSKPKTGNDTVKTRSSAAAAATAGSVSKEPRRPHLNPEKESYKSYLAVIDAREISKPIHQEDVSSAERVLLRFDFDPTYGPAVGISRLERWQRAKTLGLDPPELVREILETEEGVKERRLRESFAFGYM